MRTEDGRQLEYLVAGPPDGAALLFHVGSPNAATNFRVVTGPASAMGLRTISYSRPGYGKSTPKPGRTVSDAVSDVGLLLDQLGVEDFCTLGWSGGGPHALACAALMPDRCRAAVSLAGVAPYQAHGIDFTAGMDASNVEEFTAAIAGIQPLSAFIDPMAAEFGSVTAAGVVEGMANLLSSVDRDALTGEFAEDMADALSRATENGIEGWRDDDLAFVQSWGFEPSEITVPVAVWQGRQDRMVPFSHGQWLAAEIPTAQPHLFAEEGHLSLIARAEEILGDLISISGIR